MPNDANELISRASRVGNYTYTPKSKPSTITFVEVNGECYEITEHVVFHLVGVTFDETLHRYGGAETTDA